MDDKTQPDSEGGDKGAQGNVSLEEQNRGLMQGMMAEREKRQQLELEVRELKGKMDAYSKKADAPKAYTREELNALVDDGKLDRARADQIMDAQLERNVKERVSADVVSAMQTQRRDERVQAELDRYLDVIPDVQTTGSEARQKVEQEFQYLVSLGDAPDKATELKALRSVFGPANKLQKSQPTRETHQETGGSTPDGDTGGQHDDDVPKGLTAAQRAYYKPLVERGMYKGWKAVTEELKHADQRLVKRYANR